MSLACPACGHANVAGSRCCSQCGHRLARSSGGETEERRQMTVMFCDLVGSTSLSERLDPEDLRHVVRAYQEVCGRAVARFEGQIAQFCSPRRSEVRRSADISESEE